MTKQELKKFIKDHKEEIILGAVSIVAGGAIFVLTKRKLKVLSSMDEDTKLCLEMFKLIDDTMKGSKAYVQMLPKDLAEICGKDELIVRDPSEKFLKATGGILFGNVIE